MHAVSDRLRLAWKIAMRKGPRLRSIVDFEVQTTLVIDPPNSAFAS